MNDTNEPLASPTSHRDGDPRRWWWVNQSTTYQHERDGQYLWAPQATKRAVKFSHWTNMVWLKLGDVLLHYAGGTIRAIGLVIERARTAPKPAELGESAWEMEGWFARVEYHELDRPIALGHLPMDLRAYVFGGPFNRSGGVNQGYLFPLTVAFAEGFAEKFTAEMPNGLRPLLGVGTVAGSPATSDPHETSESDTTPSVLRLAETAPSAHNHLDRLPSYTEGYIRDLATRILNELGRPASSKEIMEAALKSGFAMARPEWIDAVLASYSSLFSRVGQQWQIYSARRYDPEGTSNAGPNLSTNIMRETSSNEGASKYVVDEDNAVHSAIGQATPQNRNINAPNGLGAVSRRGNSPLSALHISWMTQGALARAGIETIEQLRVVAQEGYDHLRAIAGLGVYAEQEVAQALELYYGVGIQVGDKDEVKDLVVGHPSLELYSEDENVPLREVLGLGGSLPREIPISALDLKLRTSNALRRNDIRTVNRLSDLSEYEVLRLRNVGVGAVEEIKAVLREAWSSLLAIQAAEGDHTDNEGSELLRELALGPSLKEILGADVKFGLVPTEDIVIMPVQRFLIRPER